jgi:hypothetical protein
MLELVILTSLKILAIHVCFQDGMILAGLRRWLYRTLPLALHKPAFDCLTCMGGFWTLVIYVLERPDCNLVDLVLSVIGLNFIIAVWKDQLFNPYGPDNQGEL